MTYYLDTLLFYSFSCSTLLVYGIGLEKVLIEAGPKNAIFNRLPVLCIETLLTAGSLWFLMTGLLIPLNLDILIPMSSILLGGMLHLLLSIIFPPTGQRQFAELMFFFGIVFLSLSEALSIIDVFGIVIASTVTFVTTTVLLLAIRNRIATSNAHADWKGTPLILISMGLLSIALYSADVSWWLMEVLK